MSLRLQHALEALYGLERRRDKHDLEGTIALLGALGNPHRAFRSVHVAGTNGKGTVCALIERVLRETGLRTGLFTSPHLVDFRERIRVCGRWADDARLEQMLERITTLPEGEDRTFFEVCTALAFQYFAEQGVEVAVVEVGLGGRLDCTNVITPDLSIITSIGLDHTEILGDTLEKIAFEKAGIIKPGVPVVIGPMADEAWAVIEQVAHERGAQVVRVFPGVRPRAFGGRFEPLAGGGNLSIAVEALGMLTERGYDIGLRPLTWGLTSMRWPGRMEECPNEPRLWWDGAHNADGVRHVVRWWTDRTRLIRPPFDALVLALSGDKDAPAILRALHEGFPEARLIATRSRSERALEPATLAARASEVGFTAETLPDVPTAVRHGLRVAGDGLVLLTGSLFAVGEAMEAFGGAPGEML